MACNDPPYCLGTGGFCQCNCGCCPPCNIITEITYKFVCGTSNEIPDPPQASPCNVTWNDLCQVGIVNTCVEVTCDLDADCNCYGDVSYKCLSGTWVLQSSSCQSPCIPEEASWFYSCTGANEGEVKALNCTCEPSLSSFYDITVSFDGCGLYPASPCTDTTCGKCITYIVVGNGTITADPDITVNCTESVSRTIGVRINGQTSLEVNDCDEIEITDYCDFNKCCPCCSHPYSKTVLAEHCGGTTYDFCDCLANNNFTKKRMLVHSLKRSILSRIKKVHYKP